MSEKHLFYYFFPCHCFYHLECTSNRHCDGGKFCNVKNGTCGKHNQITIEKNMNIRCDLKIMLPNNNFQSIHSFYTFHLRLYMSLRRTGQV